MNNKIIILGVSGMLGHTLFKYFSKMPEFKAIGTARAKNNLSHYYNKQELSNIYDNIDANNFDSIIDVFGKFKPDIVINCIGIIKQLKEANNPYICLNINSLFPHKLAKFTEATNSRLIHISTDCVFEGKKGNYTEEDNSNAYDIYGKTKNLGELTDYPNAVTIRTSIIGHELNKSLSLVDWFLSQKESVRGYTNAIYSGFPTIEIAEIIHKYIIPNNELRGLYHVSSEPINKYELLKLIAEVYGKIIEIKPYGDFVLDRSLNSEKFRKITKYNPPSWPELIKKMHKESLKNNSYNSIN